MCIHIFFLLKKLFNTRVIVFGIGGVGSYVVEALVRFGIGAIDIVDELSGYKMEDFLYAHLPAL